MYSLFYLFKIYELTRLGSNVIQNSWNLAKNRRFFGKRVGTQFECAITLLMGVFYGGGRRDDCP
jgi:hypothetical protein